jgi:lipoic acid synthetase
MLGLGETIAELDRTLQELRAAGCDLLTLGQYLQPSLAHLPVKRFYAPEEFAELAARARLLGFTEVAAAPLVRSSYRAEALARRAPEPHPG